MISVYDIGNETYVGEGNYAKNGDAVLTPLSCKARLVAGGSYDLTLVHPIDPEGKWKHLVPGAIVKAPVPRETIENARAGYDADVYVMITDTGLRETMTEPEAITYQYWVNGREYSAGDRVTIHETYATDWNGRNFQAVVDIVNAASTAPPPTTYYWQEIARYTSGPNVLATLPAGTELYLVADVDATWYQMSTYYGITGYVKKSEVTFSRHLSPSETQAHVIEEQLFRLREPVIDDDANTVTVTGMHVSYDLNGVLVSDISLSQASPGYALSRITEAFMIGYRGTIATNLTAADNGTYTGDIKGKNGMFALLDPDCGIVARFRAKFTRDNWDLFVMTRTDVDRGYRIRYGKNARGIQWKQSSTALVNRVVPVAKAENGEDLYLPEMWIDSPLINSYPVIIMERLQVKGQVGKDDGTGTDTVWTEAALLDEMRAKATERFTVDHADVIAEEVTIQIEQLGDMVEFAWLKDLETILLYDQVKAVEERTGMNLTLYVTEIEYDCIRKKVAGLKLSNNDGRRGGNVTGYNIQNNSIGSAKLTDEAKAELIEQAMYQAQDVSAAAAEKVAVTVEDNLTSTSAENALSAKQGKVLNESIKRIKVTKTVSISQNSSVKFCNYSNVAADCTFDNVISVTPDSWDGSLLIAVRMYSDGIYVHASAAISSKPLALHVAYHSTGNIKGTDVNL